MDDPTLSTSRLPPAIGRFQIVRKLGAGGMGDVYEGFDAAVSRYAAVKILRRSLLERSEVAEHFVLEAQRIAKLEAHPNIPTIYEVGVHEGLPFLAMQKIEGDSLAALLKKRGVASLALLRSVASGIGSALAFAHDRSIVHCDVKPQNVLVDLAGKPYLTDFGISRARPDPLGGDESPLHGLTPYYASPEQSRGAPADARSDVYSFGILLYEMCTGCNPWIHVSSSDLADVLAHQRPARADARNRHVPSALADALQSALEADPTLRPTAVELARLVLRTTDSAARWTIARQAELGIECEPIETPRHSTAGGSNGLRWITVIALAAIAAAIVVLWPQPTIVDAFPNSTDTSSDAGKPAEMAQTSGAPTIETTPRLEPNPSAAVPPQRMLLPSAPTTPEKLGYEAAATNAPSPMKTPQNEEREDPLRIPDEQTAHGETSNGPSPSNLAQTDLRPEPDPNIALGRAAPSPSVEAPAPSSGVRPSAAEAVAQAHEAARRMQDEVRRGKNREAAGNRAAIESLGEVLHALPWITARIMEEREAPTQQEKVESDTPADAAPQAEAPAEIQPAQRRKLDPGAAVPRLPARPGPLPGMPFPRRRDGR